MTEQPQKFALVLAIWGTRYGPAHVNEIANGAFQLSPGLSQLVLLTDRLRDGIDPRVRQKLFPAPFNEPEFFGHGYRAKLAVFAAIDPDLEMASVFLDLDSVVVGDLGRIAALVDNPGALWMLPGAGLGFSKLRGLIDRIRGSKTHFPIGNSSVLAFHSAAHPNLAATYAELYRDKRFPDGWASVIDDVLISWFGRGKIRGIPYDCAVMFRREFLSRLPLWPRLKAKLPHIRLRREKIAAITMNGISVKAEVLAAQPRGAVLGDGRGRTGIWSEAGFGTLWAPLVAASQRITSATQREESD
jgi:hypothetical protein